MASIEPKPAPNLGSLEIASRKINDRAGAVLSALNKVYDRLQNAPEPDGESSEKADSKSTSSIIEEVHTSLVDTDITLDRVMDQIGTLERHLFGSTSVKSYSSASGNTADSSR